MGKKTPKITSAWRKGRAPRRAAGAGDALGRGTPLCCGRSQAPTCTHVGDAASCFRGRSPAGTGSEAPQPTAPDSLCPPLIQHGLPTFPRRRGDGLCWDGQHRSSLAQLAGVARILFTPQGRGWRAGTRAGPVPDTGSPPRSPPRRGDPT